jgi:DNA-binding IclR family transcriptional regulator
MTRDGFVPWRAESPGAQAINRAAVILRILAVHGAEGACVGQIAEATGLAPSTVHRLLSALVDERLAERVRGTRGYRLGMEVVALGAAAGTKHDLRSLARAPLERLTARLGHASHLLIRAGYDVVCLDQCVPEGGAGTIGGIGSRAPLGVSATGLALLAFLGEDDIRDAMAHNRARLAGHAAFSVEGIMAEIGITRQRGYGISSVDSHPRVFGLAVPVLDMARRPLAALGITTVGGEPLEGRALDRAVVQLKDEAARVARDYEAQHAADAEGWRHVGGADVA